MGMTPTSQGRVGTRSNRPQYRVAGRGGLCTAVGPGRRRSGWGMLPPRAAASPQAGATAHRGPHEEGTEARGGQGARASWLAPGRRQLTKPTDQWVWRQVQVKTYLL